MTTKNDQVPDQLSASTSAQEMPIHVRLMGLRPDPSEAMYFGQRMVKLTVEELDEVIATIEGLQKELLVARSQAGRSKEEAGNRVVGV